jgi:hypothetical protein
MEKEAERMLLGFFYENNFCRRVEDTRQTAFLFLLSTSLWSYSILPIEGVIVEFGEKIVSFRDSNEERTSR